MVYFFIWLILSFLIPFILASDKRQIGFFLGFISCFFLSPLIGFIIIILSKEKTEKEKASANVSNEIFKLNELHQKGLISKEQLDTQIKKMLD